MLVARFDQNSISKIELKQLCMEYMMNFKCIKQTNENNSQLI